MILGLIRCVSDDIEKSMMYIAFSINIFKIKSLFTNVSKIYSYESLLIVYKLSMIYLRFFLKIDRHLHIAQDKIISSIFLFNDPLLVIFISKFY